MRRSRDTAAGTTPSAARAVANPTRSDTASHHTNTCVEILQRGLPGITWKARHDQHINGHERAGETGLSAGYLSMEFPPGQISWTCVGMDTLVVIPNCPQINIMQRFNPTHPADHPDKFPCSANAVAIG